MDVVLFLRMLNRKEIIKTRMLAVEKIKDKLNLNREPFTESEKMTLQV